MIKEDKVSEIWMLWRTVKNGVIRNAISWEGIENCKSSVGNDCNVEGKCEV